LAMRVAVGSTLAHKEITWGNEGQNNSKTHGNLRQSSSMKCYVAKWNCHKQGVAC
jgi:hypothetical protein